VKPREMLMMSHQHLHRMVMMHSLAMNFCSMDRTFLSMNVFTSLPLILLLSIFSNSSAG
jgi:hypothetical protein